MQRSIVPDRPINQTFFCDFVKNEIRWMNEWFVFGYAFHYICKGVPGTSAAQMRRSIRRSVTRIGKHMEEVEEKHGNVNLTESNRKRASVRNI